MTKVAEKALKTIKAEDLTRFFEMCLRGYTLRRIKYDIPALALVPDAQLILLMRENGVKMEADRADLDARTLLEYGLTDRLERVRRLSENADMIEGKVTSDPKWASEYRQYLGAIQRELEPMGLTIVIGDKWAELLQDLTSMASSGGEQLGNSESESLELSATTTPPARLESSEMIIDSA